MEPNYQQLPELWLIPLAKGGTVILGVPVDTKEYVNDAIRNELAECDQLCQKLFRFQFANCFIILTRYCPNRKPICQTLSWPKFLSLNYASAC